MRGLGPGVLVLLAAACGGAPPRGQPGGELPTCCANSEEVKRLAGKRVALVGTYTPRFVVQRADDEARLLARGERPRTVEIVRGDAAPVVMLGVYYHRAGTRDRDELERWAGKRVRVVGTLHERAPERSTADGIPMATMVAPYLGEIEGISAAD